eukprot:6208551-Pleurochrysis_carterae.AAC.1
MLPPGEPCAKSALRATSLACSVLSQSAFTRAPRACCLLRLGLTFGCPLSGSRLRLGQSLCQVVASLSP